VLDVYDHYLWRYLLSEHGTRDLAIDLLDTMQKREKERPIGKIPGATAYRHAIQGN
jgi:hypothetical protein